MELIIQFEFDNLGDARLNLSVKDMSVIDILAAINTLLGMVIIEVEKQFDVEIDAGLIEEVIRKIKNEQR